MTNHNQLDHRDQVFFYALVGFTKETKKNLTSHNMVAALAARPLGVLLVLRVAVVGPVVRVEGRRSVRREHPGLEQAGKLAGVVAAAAAAAVGEAPRGWVGGEQGEGAVGVVAVGAGRADVCAVGDASRAHGGGA
jgi:hypothetical protein